MSTSLEECKTEVVPFSFRILVRENRQFTGTLIDFMIHRVQYRRHIQLSKTPTNHLLIPLFTETDELLHQETKDQADTIRKVCKANMTQKDTNTFPIQNSAN